MSPFRTIQIPLSPWSSPVKITIDGIYIIAGPQRQQASLNAAEQVASGDSAARIENSIKRKKVAALLDFSSSPRTIFSTLSRVTCTPFLKYAALARRNAQAISRQARGRQGEGGKIHGRRTVCDRGGQPAGHHPQHSRAVRGLDFNAIAPVCVRHHDRGDARSDHGRERRRGRVQALRRHV